jgi:cytochrome bd-type quinol oxidase subunit 2
MDPGLIFKSVVIVLLLIIFFTLTGGMVFLIQDKGKSDRTVKTLTVRIALSIALFVLLFVGFATGLIKPHGLTPAHPPQTEKAPQ